MTKLIPIQLARQRIERKAAKRYATQVLDAFARLEHDDKREAGDKRAEVERKARNEL